MNFKTSFLIITCISNISISNNASFRRITAPLISSTMQQRTARINTATKQSFFNQHGPSMISLLSATAIGFCIFQTGQSLSKYAESTTKSTAAIKHISQEQLARLNEQSKAQNSSKLQTTSTIMNTLASTASLVNHCLDIRDKAPKP